MFSDGPAKRSFEVGVEMVIPGELGVEGRLMISSGTHDAAVDD
jgi:hypothetical protein